MKENGLEFKKGEFLEFGGIALKVSKMCYIFVILSAGIALQHLFVSTDGSSGLHREFLCLMRG